MRYTARIGRLIVLALAISTLPTLTGTAFGALAPSTVNMRMPFPHSGEWKVINGYNRISSYRISC